MLLFWSPDATLICGCENYGYGIDGKFCDFSDDPKTTGTDSNGDPVYGGDGSCIDCSTYLSTADCDADVALNSDAIDDCKDKCINFKDLEFWYWDYGNSASDRIFGSYTFKIKYSLSDVGVSEYWIGNTAP